MIIHIAIAGGLLLGLAVVVLMSSIAIKLDKISNDLFNINTSFDRFIETISYWRFK